VQEGHAAGIRPVARELNPLSTTTWIDRPSPPEERSS
jgi:hypothetical protein